jgi:hypothetical protein
LGRFDRPAADVLECVAEARLDENPTIRAEALVIHLQTLWRMKDLDDIGDLASTVKELGQMVPEDTRLILDATWLRTLCKAGEYQGADVHAFVALLEAMGGPERTSYQRIAMVIGQVAGEFNNAGHISDSRTLCEAAYRLVEVHGDGPMLANIALQIAELSAHLKDAKTARLYLGRAESWGADEHDDLKSAFTARTNALFARGRTLARLADQTEPADETLYREAYDALQSARVFAQGHRLEIEGQVDLYLAEVSWWLGRTAVNLGHLDEACECLKAVRSDAAMANRHFRDEVVSRAWQLEAESLALSGRVKEAAGVAGALIANDGFSDRSKKRAREFVLYLNEGILPVVDWFSSDAAQSIARDCVVRGLRTTVARQIKPLVEWWQDWHKPESGAESELLDFWGRGGFSTVAAAIRMKPYAAIAVDARSVGEIRNWARVLCPLFDTVIVKWKGELGAGLVLVPQHEDYEGAGGHGYSVTSDHTDNKRYAVSMSWANPIPREVTSFLAGEALSLISAGRLLVLPAPLVGCSQSAVGWTDNLLVEGLLGGVIDVTRNTVADANASQRVLDLSRVRLPFVDNISMSDLAIVLDDADRWTGPLRGQIMKVLASGDLNHERWASIAGLEHEIQGACRELNEGLAGIVHGRDWRLVQVDASIAAGSRGPVHAPGHESITGLLQSVASSNRELAPWIPYWRLQDRGGFLNWTCPLDNKSTPPDRGAMMQKVAKGAQKPAELHAWLYPGTPGWSFPTGFILPVGS